MERRILVSGDPKDITDDQIDAQTFAELTARVNTILPYLNILNGDSIAHTFTVLLRGTRNVSTMLTVAAGAGQSIPTLGVVTVVCDSAGAPSSVARWYGDIPFPKPAGGTGGGFTTPAASVYENLNLSTYVPSEQISAEQMGLGSAVHITPLRSGKVLAICSGIWSSTAVSTAETAEFNISYGTGVAPVYQAALTGTQLQYTEIGVTTPVGGLDVLPFTLAAVVTGLTVATAYWFDLSYYDSDTTHDNVTYVQYSLVELVN